MVEKVEDAAGQAAASASDAPFVSRAVKKCPSCGTVNAGDATRCGGCGGELSNLHVDTVPAACPNCAGDRPFIPEFLDADEQYDGECPHCHQSEADAMAALEKLKHGDSNAFPKAADD